MYERVRVALTRFQEANRGQIDRIVKNKDFPEVLLVDEFPDPETATETLMAAALTRLH